jgi:hypothetical protein
MRLSMGLGYLHTKVSLAGEDDTISGGGMAMSFALGGIVARNLAIYGEVVTTMAAEPTREYGGRSMDMSSINVSLTGLGPGVVYYLEPLNLYFSGTLALSNVTFSDSNDSSNSEEVTDFGVGASLALGKEWWVSNNWGIGVSTMFHLASMKVKDTDTRMTAAAISFLFSATYN